MKSFFNFFTSLSLRFRAVTLLLVAVVLVLGGVAITQLNQELLPPIEFPQTIILAQATGMTSEQVLTVLTKRLEAELDKVDEVANLESTTTGAFGAVITARNDFGLNQERLIKKIQTAIDQVWLPLRHIQPSAGEDAAVFAKRLLGDMTPDVLIYLAEQDPNFLFNLSPEVWAVLPDDTVKQTLAYLANQTAQTGGSALQQTVDQELVPQIEALDLVANVQVSGGQALPGDTTALASTETTQRSVLLQLSPEVWSIVAPRVGATALDDSAVTTLQAVSFTVPTDAPALPESWQMDRFSDATDLLEVRTLTTNAAQLFNGFYENGEIIGALGQTNDLTPDDVQQLLTIDPSLVKYFDADQLAALSPEVFALLPEDYIAGLDGFTRDALAAAALAKSITGEDVEREPVNLPGQWRISPPQLITFSLADLPLATFSISTKATAGEVANTSITLPTDTSATTTTTESATETDNNTTTPTAQDDIPQGPPLPFLLSTVGGFIGIELNTADDLLNITLPENLAQQFGGDSLSAAQLLNFLILLSDPSKLPAGADIPTIPIDVKTIIGALSPEAISFVAQYDPTFLPTLSTDVYNVLSDDVLKQPQIAPPLADVWGTLAQQPQFAGKSLKNAADILTIDGGKASTVLNTINDTVPERFAGYEVRLFDSLSPAVVRYFALQQSDFYQDLHVDVLKKFSPAALKVIPADVIAGLDPAVAGELTAIADGTQTSAFAVLSERYTLNVPPADPNAPALNTDWQTIGNFLGVELDTADDFSRFYPSTTNFLNSFFDSAQGVAFAPNLFGHLSLEALNYMADKDTTLLDGLRVDALQLLSEDVLKALPQAVQDRASAGGIPFIPTSTVTRANDNASLQVVIYKTRDANTVEAFHQVDDLIKEAQTRDPNLLVSVAFEQASFIEESISGVAREGSLGAFFAMVVILIFLSSGHWSTSPRRITGLVLTVIFGGLLVLIVAGQAGTPDGFSSIPENTLIGIVLLTLAIVTGLLLLILPGSFNVPYPAWRATLVIGVSIPVSVMAAMAVMRWVSPTMHNLLAGPADSSPFFAFLIRLFPAKLTLNIMTLSGLTVAIGRVVDDSIVVLENIIRQLQSGVDKREAILSGVRDVSQAIFVATLVTVVVFLPLGLTGGIIGEFFLPFGLAVTYSLLASFVVAITVVPVLVFLFIRREEGEEHEGESPLERLYRPVLRWALTGNSGWIVLGLAVVSMVFGFALFGGRPTQFLPDFGELQIGITANLPTGTKIVETNNKVAQMEAKIKELIPETERGTVLTIVGGTGASLESLFTGSQVSENQAAITIGAKVSKEKLDEYTSQLRTEAEAIFGPENVRVSAASLTQQGFGGFSLVLSGPQEDLVKINDAVIATLDGVPGITNVSSNLATPSANGDSNAAATLIQIDGETAVSYSAELETQNTIGVTQEAIAAVKAIPDLPATIKISQGFQTETQIQGFQGLFVAMGIAIAIMVVIMVITFGSPVYWLAIILSIIVAPVGAAIALTLTNSVLGISALIGLLMLIGIVVTNAVVLIDRAHTNDVKRNMPVKDALMEAGDRRLRPIVMTALATIMALIPLALGLSKGAIIAAQLGTVVIGGLFSSTLLTLLVVPVAYKLLHPLNSFLVGLVRPGSRVQK